MDETPEFMNPMAALEAIQAAKHGENAAAKLKTMAQAGKVEMPDFDDPDRPRQFIAPQYPNSKYLVRAGTLISAPYQQTTLGLQPSINRNGGEGDLWVKFASGVCATNDPEVIEWLEAHAGHPDTHLAYHKAHKQEARNCGAPIGLCHESGPGVDDWATLKLAQIPTANRPASIPPEVDLDAFLRGDHVNKVLPAGAGIGAKMAQTADSNADAEVRRNRGNV